MHCGSTTKPKNQKNALDRYGNPAPYFRKVFTLKGTPVKAILKLGAMGVVKAYINGEAVADDYMTPGFTDYRKRLFVRDHDERRNPRSFGAHDS